MIAQELPFVIAEFGAGQAADECAHLRTSLSGYEAIAAGRFQLPAKPQRGIPARHRPDTNPVEGSPGAKVCALDIGFKPAENRFVTALHVSKRGLRLIGASLRTDLHDISALRWCGRGGNARLIGFGWRCKQIDGFPG